MSHTRTNRKKNVPLLVKEVILPSKKPESAQCSKNNHKAGGDDLKKDADEFDAKTTSTNVIIGGGEVLPIGELVILEKKPLESYFEEVRGKRVVRNKIRQPKRKRLEFRSWPTACNEGWISALTGAGLPPKTSDSNMVEEILHRQAMQVTIKMEEQAEQEIFMEQKLAEQNYIREQVNLMETWLGVTKRQSRTRPTGCSMRTSAGSNRIEVSHLRKEFRDDDDDSGGGKGEKFSLRKGERNKVQKKSVSVQEKSTVVDVAEELTGKLVFVDDDEEVRRPCRW